MMQLVFPATMLSELLSELRKSKKEAAAIVLAQPVHFAESNSWRLLVREHHVVPVSAYDIRSPTEVQPSSQFLVSCESRARKKGWSIVYCHSHPRATGLPKFSTKDDRTEKLLARYLGERFPDIPHISLLVGMERLNCRILGESESVQVMSVGRSLVFEESTDHGTEQTAVFDRQIRAFGVEGQRQLEKLRITVVGLGGTGSAVAQQLAYLGVQNYVLVDHDHVENTNLNRLLGATSTDVGKSKVSVAHRMIRSVRQQAKVAEIVGDVVDENTSKYIVQSDLIFCCTDSHASRNLLNTISYQYYVPCIDMGVVLTPREDADLSISGRVNLLAPGLACLTCLDTLDPSEIRRELLDAKHRNADPYFSENVGVSQPAVISLNSTVASLAITMFLSAVAGIPAAARGQYYDGNLGRVRPVTMRPHPTCVTCSSDYGILGLGDTVPLPVRRQ